MNYKAYGYILKSEFPLSSLIEVDTDEAADITIEKKDLSALTNHLRKKELYFFSSTEQDIWVYYETVGSFNITDGKTIAVDPIIDVLPYLVESVILGFCMGSVMYQQKLITMHGGCISFDNECWLICGESGAGKSTLVTQLLQEENALLISDDVVRISKEGLAFPSIPRVKLCQDLANRMQLQTDQLPLLNEDRLKYGLLIHEHFSAQPKTITAIFMLRLGEELSVTPLTGYQKYNHLLSNFYPDYLYQTLLLQKEQLQACLQLSKSIKMYEIVRPKGTDTAAMQVDLMKKIRSVLE